MFGYDSAFIGGALTLPSFQTRFGLESVHGTRLANLKANIVSTFQAGAFFGAILVYPITERFGRRPTLLLCGLLFNLGAIAQLASGGEIAAIYAGRVLTGTRPTFGPTDIVPRDLRIIIRTRCRCVFLDHPGLHF